MKKLWLTYAWKDNENADIDHVIAELQRHGIDVRYDRVQLRAGRRLWDQIDAAIRDPEIRAWAMFVTENSLRSEPCQEEIAYAIDRTLRTRGGDFPLIGIFPEPLDRSIIPSAIATRLYVNLRDPLWVQRVAGGVNDQETQAVSTPPPPFGHELRTIGGKFILEVWPRSGRWYPFGAAVPFDEASKLEVVLQGPRGGLLPLATVIVSMKEIGRQGDPIKGYLIHHAIDLLNSAYIQFSELPTRVLFGDPKERMLNIHFGPDRPFGITPINTTSAANVAKGDAKN